MASLCDLGGLGGEIFGLTLNQQRDNVKDAIAVTLEEDPLCPQIVEFLPENQAPVDSARGIAAWWVHCDELALVTARE